MGNIQEGLIRFFIQTKYERFRQLHRDVYNLPVFFAGGQIIPGNFRNSRGIHIKDAYYGTHPYYSILPKMQIHTFYPAPALTEASSRNIKVYDRMMKLK